MVRLSALLLALLGAVACAAPAEGPQDATHVLELRSGWEFAPGEEPQGIERLPAAWQPVKLPHRQEAAPCGFYRASFAVPAAWAGMRVSLVARPLAATARVWLNGRPLGVRSPSALDVRLDATQALRTGARNSVLIAVVSLAEQEQRGLAACRLEAAGAVGIERLAATPWCLAGGAVVDVALDVANGGRERFEGRVELAFEAEAEGKQPPRLWRRASDVRMDAGQSASVAQSFEPDPPRLWRPDDPYLYRLMATVQTREGQAVRSLVARVGLRSAAPSQGRWLANGEWVRLAGAAFAAPGATLICTQPGQPSGLAAKLAAGQEPPLDELLAFCDEAGIIALLDAPACPAETPGWRETLDALAAEALRHPCVWGWMVKEAGVSDEGGGVRGEGEDRKSEIRNPKSEISTLARLRELTPRLPIGCPMPVAGADARGFDFLVSRYATRPGREDDDAYGKRLDDLARDAGSKCVIAIDRITETEDKARTDGSLAHRCREVERRQQIAILAFELEPDAELFALAEKRLSPFRLNPPSHEARLEREQFVVKSRFEVQLASPVAQRLPCYSLFGCRIAWTASRGDALVASGALPLTNAQPRAIEGGCQPGRGEVEWRVVGGASLPREETVEFAAELQTASGRVLARQRAKLFLKAKDGRAEVGVEALDKQGTP